MKNIILGTILCICFWGISQAQNNSETGSTTREEILEEINQNKEVLVGLLLSIDKTNNNSFVKVIEGKSSIENISVADKVKINQAYAAMEQLQTAKSFFEVIQYASGYFFLKSHQVVDTDKKTEHYFIFTY